MKKILILCNIIICIFYTTALSKFPPPKLPKSIIPKPSVSINFKKPIITTIALSSIKNTSARSGGSISSPSPALAITARGVCWSTEAAPTIANFKNTEGAGSGNFNSQMYNLKSGVTYHIRAYATHANGTIYGNELTFTTQVKDKDGNDYETVTIGTQVWMKQNLRSTRNTFGDPITLISTDADWRLSGRATYTIYDNNPSNATIYGNLYNWYSATNNLAPDGWHLPSKAEWQTLISYLGTNAGNKMKATTLWTVPSSGVINTNSSDFTALPAGYRLYDVGTSSFLGTKSIFWSSTISSADELAWACYLDFDLPNATIGENVWHSGFSVRCIRN